MPEEPEFFHQPSENGARALEVLANEKECENNELDGS